MDPLLLVLVFAHIGGGAVWLGASAFANVVVLPYLTAMPQERRPELVRALVLGPERLVIGAAVTAGLSGLALGFAERGFGTTTSIGSAAGLVWLASIAIAVAVFATGGRVTSPAARALAAGSSGDTVLQQLRAGFRAELGGILAILALMVVLAHV